MGKYWWWDYFVLLCENSLLHESVFVFDEIWLRIYVKRYCYE